LSPLSTKFPPLHPLRVCAFKMVDKPEASILKRQRATIKASCTHIRTYIESIAAISSSIVAQLEEWKAKLELYWAEYNDVQSRLESLDESEGCDRDGFEEALSGRICEPISLSPTLRASIFFPSSSNVRESDSSTDIRLSKLNLLTFSGKYDEWFPFFDIFNLVIHSNTSLSNTQRFQYLRASLIGDTSAVISSLELSDANYDVAWTILRERYDNKRVIVQTHISAIFDLPTMTRENEFELRRLSDTATKHLHTLQALKRPTTHWDDLLVHLLTSKLDSLTLRER